jgi:hypothetical protein
MMLWRAVVALSVSTAASLSFLRELLSEHARQPEWAAGLGQLQLLVALSLFVSTPVALGCIFLAGASAFGPWSGTKYTLLAVLLLLLPGIYLVPALIRLDVQRQGRSPNENSEGPRTG